MLQPRNLEQRMHPFKEGVCTLFLSWDPMQDVTDYMVFLNGNNIGTTPNTSYALLVYCDSHTVRLQAINRCGQMSPNAPDAPVLPESFLYSDITTEQESDGGESSEPLAIGKFVTTIIILLIHSHQLELLYSCVGTRFSWCCRNYSYFHCHLIDSITTDFHKEV